MKKSIKFLFITVLVFLYSNSFAQDAKEKVSIEYGGKVLSKESKEALQGVVVIYTDPKTGEISGSVTDYNGKFLITVPKTVPYLTFSHKNMVKKKLILSEVDSANYMKLEIYLIKEDK